MSRVKLDTNRLTEYLATVYPDSTEPEKQALVQRDRSWSEFFFHQGNGNRMAGKKIMKIRELIQTTFGRCES
jgi:hypothetical protein